MGLHEGVQCHGRVLSGNRRCWPKRLGRHVAGTRVYVSDDDPLIGAHLDGDSDSVAAKLSSAHTGSDQVSVSDLRRSLQGGAHRSRADA